MQQVADMEEKQPLLHEELPEYSEKEALPEAAHSTSSRHRQLWLVLLSALVIVTCDVVDRSVPWETLVTPRRSPYSHAAAHYSGAKAVEEAFLAVPQAQSILEISRNLTSYVHIAGTREDKHSALVIKERWTEALGLPVTKPKKHVFDAGSHASARWLTAEGRGDRVWTDTYYPMLSYPTNTSFVRLYDANGRSLFNASLHEDPLDEDATSRDEVLGSNPNVTPFHSFSKGGGAKGQVVYANLGRYQDYQLLQRLGISIKDKIVLVRYGGPFRGLKVHLAAKGGAAAVLIYSDPFEDGDITAANGYAPYPHGPARQPSSVQRGSVNKLSLFPGDPLTPGKPAYKKADRVSREDAKALVEIPSLPISYQDALPLLRSLEGRGQRLGGEWEGALEGINYWTGPSEAVVDLFNGVKESVGPIWNTYALIEGHVTDEIVAFGVHRDAWVFGAVDPISGTSTINEVVKALGELRKTGWKPFRSILVCSWDGEEYGLMGSTEFGEDYSEWIRDHIVAYLNADSVTKGSGLNMRASPSLAHLVVNALHDAGPSPGDRYIDSTVEDVGDVGSGSDYTVFLQHLGIAATHTEFSQRRKDPVYHYHSIYDSQYWSEDFGDPGFVNRLFYAKWFGLTALRLADSPLLPFNVTHYATVLTRYSARIKTALESSVMAKKEHALDLEPLNHAVKKVLKAAHHLDAAIAIEHKCPHKRGRALKLANDAAREFEKGFIDREGLPDRPWYRHLGVAPGRWLGYGSTSFPGLYEAITIDEDAKLARHEAKRLVKRLGVIAKALERAAEDIEG